MNLKIILPSENPGENPEEFQTLIDEKTTLQTLGEMIKEGQFYKNFHLSEAFGMEIQGTKKFIFGRETKIISLLRNLQEQNLVLIRGGQCYSKEYDVIDKQIKEIQQPSQSKINIQQQKGQQIGGESFAAKLKFENQDQRLLELQRQSSQQSEQRNYQPVIQIVNEQNLDAQSLTQSQIIEQRLNHFKQVYDIHSTDSSNLEINIQNTQNQNQNQDESQTNQNNLPNFSQSQNNEQFFLQNSKQQNQNFNHYSQNIEQQQQQQYLQSNISQQHQQSNINSQQSKSKIKIQEQISGNSQIVQRQNQEYIKIPKNVVINAQVLLQKFQQKLEESRIQPQDVKSLISEGQNCQKILEQFIQQSQIN